MTNFDSVKAKVLSIAKEKQACADQSDRARNASTIEELLQVVKDNFIWSCNNGILSPEMIEEFGIEVLNANKLYVNQNASEGFLLAFGSATVRASGSATVTAFDSATVRAFDSAYINSYSSIDHQISGKAICRYYYENRVVVASEIKTIEKK